MNIKITMNLFNMGHNRNNCFSITCLENCVHNKKTICTTINPILTIGNNDIVCQSQFPIYSEESK